MRGRHTWVYSASMRPLRRGGMRWPAACLSSRRWPLRGTSSFCQLQALSVSGVAAQVHQQPAQRAWAPASPRHKRLQRWQAGELSRRLPPAARPRHAACRASRSASCACRSISAGAEAVCGPCRFSMHRVHPERWCTRHPSHTCQRLSPRQTRHHLLPAPAPCRAAPHAA